MVDMSFSKEEMAAFRGLFKEIDRLREYELFMPKEDARSVELTREILAYQRSRGTVGAVITLTDSSEVQTFHWLKIADNGDILALKN